MVIYTYVRALWFVLVDWLLGDDLDEEGVPETCDWCRVERPADPLSWERWELVHEHLERAW